MPLPRLNHIADSRETPGGFIRVSAEPVGHVNVLGLSPFLHIRVVTALHGDGTSFGTFVTIRDPDDPFPYDEFFINFAQKYDGAAVVDHRMDQIWHK